jgi:phosphoribosyl-dephospho-CoA transferase
MGLAEKVALEGTLAVLPDRPSSSAQRRIFELVRQAVQATADDSVVSPEDDLRLRQEARSDTGFELFEVRTRARESDTELEASDRLSRLLDVEVVAIYW